MKLLALLLIAFIFSLNSYSQTSQAEAKAAYLLAEDSYGKGDYKAALRYLETAKKSLGASNSKILYLQIQSELELSKVDSSNSQKILSLITEFEKSAGIKTFDEEKILEVSKTKLLLKAQLADAEEKTRKEEHDKVLAENAIKIFEGWYVWKFASTLEEMTNKNPQFSAALNRKTFKRDSVRTMKNGGTEYTFRGLTLQFNKQKELTHAFFIAVLFNIKEDADHLKGKALKTQRISDFRSTYGYLPKPILYGEGGSHEDYVIKSGKKELALKFDFSGSSSTCVITFSPI